MSLVREEKKKREGRSWVVVVVVVVTTTTTTTEAGKLVGVVEVLHCFLVTCCRSCFCLPLKLRSQTGLDISLSRGVTKNSQVL